MHLIVLFCMILYFISMQKINIDLLSELDHDCTLKELKQLQRLKKKFVCRVKPSLFVRFHFN